MHPFIFQLEAETDGQADRKET